MSCCRRNPYDPLQTTWTQEGNLIQNNYTPPDGWPYNPKDKWPMGVTEGYWSASNYTQSSDAWRRISNITPDNSNYMNTFATMAMPAMYAEKYAPGIKSTSASNFATLRNTWTLSKPYSS